MTKGAWSFAHLCSGPDRNESGRSNTKGSAALRREISMTVSGFIDESGKFRDHKIICIGCVAAFNERLGGFAQEWGRLLQSNGMMNFHATKALRHHVPLGTKIEAKGLEQRIDALLPFIACIRKHLEVVIGCWVDAKAFKELPSDFFRVFGNDPSYMAFV